LHLVPMFPFQFGSKPLPRTSKYIWALLIIVSLLQDGLEVTEASELVAPRPNVPIPVRLKPLPVNPTTEPDEEQQPLASPPPPAKKKKKKSVPSE
jgi:hypothetical protein